jgi:predicted DNA-binding transcriptional regulator AlpA
MAKVKTKAVQVFTNEDYPHGVSVLKFAGKLNLDRRVVDRAIRNGDVPAPTKIHPKLSRWTVAEANSIVKFFQPE